MDRPPHEKEREKTTTNGLGRRLIGRPKNSGARDTEEMNEGAQLSSTYHGNAPMFGCFGDGIGDGIAGSTEDHYFARILVHHVEKSFHAHRGAAL